MQGKIWPRREYLDGQIRWNRLLEVLGCRAVQEISLPARAQCPVCRQPKMQLFFNTMNTSTWYWCPVCRQAGDLVQLAARAWGLSVEAAIGRLGHSGLLHPPTDEEVQQYMDHLTARTAAVGLWRAAEQRHIYNSRSASEVLFKRRILRELPSYSRWEIGLGAMLGWLDREELQQRAHLLGSLRIPRQCEEILVLTGRDLPLRITSFVFIHDVQEQLPWPFVLHPLSCRYKGGPTNIDRDDFMEGGLIYHPAIRQAANQWDRQIVATPNLNLMLRMQADYFESSTLPLPLATFLDGSIRQRGCVRTHYAWGMFHGYRIVLWLPELTAETVRQMMLADAWVCTWQPGQGQSKLSVFDRQEDILRHVLDQAKHWPEVVCEYLSAGDDRRAENLLAEMLLRNIRPEPILDAASGPLRKRLKRILDSWYGETGRSVIYGRFRIVERSDGWYLMDRTSHKYGELLTDALPKIHQVVHYKDSAKTYYRGEIRYRGRDWPFMEEREAIDNRNTIQWLDTFMAVNGIGIPQINPRWARFLLGIAKVFRPPELVTVSGSLGWDAEGGRFVLPRFAIRVGGEVLRETGLLLAERHPTEELDPPMSLTPEELARPKGRAGRLFWAVLAALLANILAPAFQRAPRKIALCGHSGQRLGETIAHAIGAQRLSRDANGMECSHRWPYLGALAGRRLLEAAEREEVGPYAVALCRELEGLWLVLKGGWMRVHEDAALAVRDDLLGELARRFVPLYLQDICRRNLRLAVDVETDWHETVLEDIAAFVERLGGDAGPVRTASTFWRTDDPAGTWASFQELMTAVVRKWWRSKRKKPIEKTRLHITPINSLVRREGLPPLNWSRLLGCLEALGKLGAVNDDVIRLMA